MAKKKLRSKVEFKDDLARLTVLKDKLDEILSRFTRMNEQEVIRLKVLEILK